MSSENHTYKHRPLVTIVIISTLLTAICLTLTLLSITKLAVSVENGFSTEVIPAQIAAGSIGGNSGG